ncbi:MAG: CHASE3 domain-containing protein [Acidobacteria bacterium]|nr:CHASE3 domain-containing protein [Acidobacteriota bacterium]
MPSRGGNPIKRVFANLPLNAKGLVVVSIPLAALLGTTLAAYSAFRQNQLADAAVRHTFEVSYRILHVLKLLVDAETGMRGYVLTGTPEFLEPYHDVMGRLPEAVAGLGSLIQDNPAQVERIRRVRRLVTQRQESLDALRSYWGRPDRPPVSSLAPLLAKGKSVMDSLRAELAAMDAEEARLMTERTQGAKRSEQWTRYAIVGGALTGLLGGLLAILVFTRGVSDRVRRLEIQAGRLAQGLPLSLEPSGKDEIGGLEQALAEAAGLLAGRDEELRRRVAESASINEALHAEVNVRREAEASLAEKARLTALAADVAVALTQAHPLRQTLQHCAQAFVQHLDAAFARVWTLNAEENVLELQASAGLYTHLDGPHGRVPVGQFKIGLIAHERQPHLTNAVAGDPRVGDQEWARREGMVAFAGYPLIVEERVVGVLAMFARQPLSQGVLQSMGSVANGIGLYIERARNLEALHKAKEEAERANLAKSEFISRTSHELRTPLNAILGFAQILEIEQPTPAQRDSLQQILRAGRHLLDLINELIDIARIESGKLAFSPEPVAVSGAVQEVCELVQPLAGRHGVEIHWDQPPSGDRHITADRQRLKQVLLNLVSNAVKYSGAGARVIVSTREAEGRLRLQVRDTGPGIPPEKIARLFSLFDRLGAERSGVEGTGMGLVLAKGLTELMGGRIGAESRVGEGSVFWVEFPIVAGPVERFEAAGGGPAAAESETAAVARHKLLYIEDNPSNIQLMERILQRRPRVRLLTAAAGRLGLELARSHRPDLILLDVHLPDIGGEQVLEELHNHPATRSIPVIIISADATPGQIQRLLKAGARSYLTKPIDVAALLKVLDETVKD